MQWGGSGIEKVVFDYIFNRIPEGSVMIELGAGDVSTREFSKVFDLYSVEHDENWLNKHPSTYIHAPLVDGWYDVEILKKHLPKKKDQRVILIDGISRRNILQNLHLFNKKAMFVVHDTWREHEIQLANDLGKALGRTPKFYDAGDNWAVI